MNGSYMAVPGVLNMQRSDNAFSRERFECFFRTLYYE